MVNKSVGLVELMGGLGNQVFQICFADFLKSKGLKVYVSNSWFLESNKDKTITQRKLELDPEKFDLNIASKNITKSFKILNLFYSNKFIDKKTFNTYTDKNLNLLNFARFNIFYGYWHELEFFENKREFIISSLLKHENFVNNLSYNSQKTLLHVRRTDYSIASEILPDKYYLKAIRELQKSGLDIDYDIFIDEETYNEDDPIFKNAKNVFTNIGESPLTTLSKMIRYKNYVIANSSFSLLAAFLNNNAKNVLYPSPWFRNSNYTPPVMPYWRPISF